MNRNSADLLDTGRTSREHVARPTPAYEVGAQPLYVVRNTTIRGRVIADDEDALVDHSSDQPVLVAVAITFIVTIRPRPPLSIAIGNFRRGSMRSHAK